MKIDNLLNPLPSTPSRGVAKSRARSGTGPVPTRSLEDSVELTPTSSQLSALAESLAQIDPTDTGKVESIRRAIAEGSFNVNEESVADAMLRASVEQMPFQPKR